MSCEECNEDILKKNREIVEKWSKEKQKLYFWYWNGVTDFGTCFPPIKPYSTGLIARFDKKCGLE